MALPARFGRRARQRSLLQRTELRPEDFIPYVRHVDERTVALNSGAVMRMWAVEGLPFETAEQAVLNGYYVALNEVWRSLDDDRVAVWQHVIRSRDSQPVLTPAGAEFGRVLDEAYLGRLATRILRRNELLVTLVVLSGATAATGLRGLFKGEEGLVAVQEQDLHTLDEMSARLEAGLRPYRPRRLAVYQDGRGLWSGMGEALHLVLTGDRTRVPVTMGDLGRTLLDVRPIFGHETIELRGVAGARYAGMLSVGEYPAWSRPGMLNGLLAADFDFVLTQSFKRLSKGAARALMSRKQNQMRSAGDKALAQREAMSQAGSELEDNRFAVGQHHLSLLIYGDSPEELRQAMAEARTKLSDGGLMARREDLSLIHTFFAQLPGAMAFRVRKAEGITSRNFAALGPLYGYPRGRRAGLHWQSPVAELKTAAGGRYAFSYHVRDVGHAMILGMTGSGKSVLLNFTLAGLAKLGARTVIFDKDRSSELFVGMMGGNYSAIRHGVPTGAAPLRAMAIYTPRYKAFLRELVARLLEVPGEALRPEELEEVEAAINGVEMVPLEARSMAVLAGQLGTGLRARLARWTAEGELGWALDCTEDTIGEGLGAEGGIAGVDVTELLRAKEVREPLMMYLFEKMDSAVGYGRTVWVVEEFHAALADPAIRRQVDNALRTWRKRNGMAILVSQSPSDAAGSEIASTLLQQTATKIFLPNPAASRDDYVTHLKCSGREYEVISRLSPMSRKFLVKQVDPDEAGNIVSGVVCELDLEGLGAILSVLSPSAEKGDFARWDAVKTLPPGLRWSAYLGARRS